MGRPEPPRQQAAPASPMGPVAKFFRAQFVRELRAAEPASTQPEVENPPAGSRTHNQKSGRAAFPRSSHVGRKKFATGPPRAARREGYGPAEHRRMRIDGSGQNRRA